MSNNKSEATPLLTSLHNVLMYLSKPADEEGNCNPDAVIRALQQHGWKIDLQQQVGGADVVVLAYCSGWG